VLGTLEAAGMEFDAIWIAGLTADAFPAPPRPHPFLPLAWLRREGVPRATAETELAFAAALMRGFTRCTEELVCSYPARRADEVCLPSPLIASLPEPAIEAFPSEPGTGGRLLASARSEPRPPHAGVSLRLPCPARGGSSLFEAQAACPFRAYARYRLRANEWPEVQHGISPLERGTLVHGALEAFWRETRTHAALLVLDAQGRLDAALDRSIEEAIAALRSPRWQALPAFARDAERDALRDVLAEWLDIERDRPPFVVEALEERMKIDAGGLQVEARVDRMDREANGAGVLLDYKTGQVKSPKALFGPRPDAPQLPLYMHALPTGRLPDVVAFAFVRRGETKAVGVAREDPEWQKRNIRSGAALYREAGATSWDDLLAQWRTTIEKLATAYAGGAAEVAPKRPQTCGNCEQHRFCRIRETGFPETGDGDDDA
jgi:probable DNA repair protein